MCLRTRFIALGLAIVVAAGVAGAQPSPVRILFVENSLTYWNDGAPSSLAYLPAGITGDDAAFLRRVAWESVQAARPDSKVGSRAN
jgi:hypothetical protein